MLTATPARRALRALRLPFTLAALLLVAPAALAQSGGGGIEAEGSITALTDSSLTVNARTFVVRAITRITDDDHNPIAFSALEVGDEVEVHGIPLAGGRLLALTIEVEDGDGGGGHGGFPYGIHAEGLVVARTDASLTVGGLTFLVTDSTRVRTEDGMATYADVQVGTRVEVRGVRSGTGALLALLIEIEDEDGGGHGGPGGGHGGGHSGLEVEGLITALSADSITVRNRTFALTDSTRIIGDDHQTLPVSALAVGVRVEVYGRMLADGTLVARLIEVEDEDGGGHGSYMEVRGAIEALTATSVTVSGRTIAVTDQTVVFGADRVRIPFASLTVGQIVEVKATANSTGALTARLIKVEGQNTYEQEVRVRAALDATGDSLVVVLGRPFAVRAFTRILGLDNAPITLATLPVGGLVEINARRDADGALVAFRIRAVAGDPAAISLTGTVTAVSSDSLSVIGAAFAAGSATVTTRSGMPGSLADVMVGQTVRVTGTASATGFTATAVEIRRAAQAGGRVASAGAGRIALPGLTVTTTAETFFVNEDGTPTTAAAITAGTTVVAYGTTAATGTLSASQVVVTPQGRSTAGEGGADAASLAIERVFPNPATASATVRYTVATAAAVRLTLVDVLGRTVLTAVDGQAAAGSHDATLDTAALPAGVYVVRLSVDGQTAQTRTLTVVR